MRAHLVAVDLERGTRGDGGGGGHTQAGNARNRLFSNKVTGGEQGDGGFLAPFRDDGELGTTMNGWSLLFSAARKFISVV
jgi:hypothetical protein